MRAEVVGVPPGPGPPVGAAAGLGDDTQLLGGQRLSERLLRRVAPAAVDKKKIRLDLRSWGT